MSKVIEALQEVSSPACLPHHLVMFACSTHTTLPSCPYEILENCQTDTAQLIGQECAAGEPDRDRQDALLAVRRAGVARDPREGCRTGRAPPRWPTGIALCTVPEQHSAPRTLWGPGCNRSCILGSGAGQRKCAPKAAAARWMSGCCRALLDNTRLCSNHAGWQGSARAG